MVKGPKPCWNLNESTFSLFIDPCEGNSDSKSLSEWYAISWDCFLTDWLPITSNLFLIKRIYSNIFRCNYLRNKKYLQVFFFNFLNLDSVLSNFKKKMSLIADVFSKLPSLKNVIRKMFRKSRLIGPFEK